MLPKAVVAANAPATVSTETMVQRSRANRPQQYTKTLKEATIEAKELRIPKATELVAQGAKAKPRSQQKKIFKRTPQQDKWYKERAYIKCGRQGHFIKNCRQG